MYSLKNVYVKLFFHFDIVKYTNCYEVELLVPSCTPGIGTIRNLYTTYIHDLCKCIDPVEIIFPVVYLKNIQNKIQSFVVQDDIRILTKFQPEYW